MEWFEDEEFWEKYAPVMFDDVRWAEVGAVAEAVARLAGPDRRVVDLCCGPGRIALELARQGWRVCGVDITRSYLETAREDAAYEGLDIEFLREDVRTFRRKGAFDTAVNLYNSFGYFKDPADDLLFARNAWASLAPGGTFIIEVLGKEIAARDLDETAAEWFERGGYTVLTETAPMDSWGSFGYRWILIDAKGRRTEKLLVQRLYAATELRRLLLEAGFTEVDLYGEWNGAPYDEDARMLIAVARKGRRR